MTKIDPHLPAANEVYRLPPPLFDARCRACWGVLAAIVLVVASFATLDLRWGSFFSPDALRLMGKFIAEMLALDLDPAFLRKLLPATLETLAMSIVGSLLAVVF